MRGAAFTRLALAGSTEAEVAVFTGHSLNDVRDILNRHYLNRDPALAKVLWLSWKTGRKVNKDFQLRSQLVESGQREKRGKPSDIKWLGN